MFFDIFLEAKLWNFNIWFSIYVENSEGTLRYCTQLVSLTLRGFFSDVLDYFFEFDFRSNLMTSGWFAT